MKNLIFLGLLAFSSNLFGQQSAEGIELTYEGDSKVEIIIDNDSSFHKTGIINVLLTRNDSIQKGFYVNATVSGNADIVKVFQIENPRQYITPETFNSSDQSQVIFVYQVNTDSTFENDHLNIFFYIDSTQSFQSPNILFNLQKQALSEMSLPSIEFNVGAFHLEKQKKIPLYKRGKNENYEKKKNGIYLFRDNCFDKKYQESDTNVDISHLSASVSQGRIHKMVVYLEDREGVFVTKGPLSVTNYMRKRNVTLYYTGSDTSLLGTFIRVGDFLNYANSGDESYFPSEDTIVLSAEKPDHQMTFKGTAEQFVDARLFTDVRGLAGAENAIAQTQIKAKFILNSNNLGRSSVTLFNYVHAEFTFSKFDSKFDTLQLDSYLNRNPTDLLSIIQRSNAAADIGADLINFQPLHQLYLQGGFKIFHTRSSVSSIDSLVVFDSLMLPTTIVNSKSLYSPAFYFAPGGIIKIGGNSSKSKNLIQIGLSVPFTWFINGDQVFSEYRGKGKGKFDLMISPELELKLSITDNDDPNKHGTSIFAKVLYSDMINYRGGSYWQVQTGVNLPLSSLISKTKK